MKRLLSTILLSSLSATAIHAGAQTIGQNKSAEGNQTITLTGKGAQLVVEDVAVKDKQGNPINGLTADDFIVTEDGVPQKVRFVDHQILPTTPLPPIVSKPSEEDIKIYKKLNNTSLAQETPDNLRYKNKRLLALYFDMSSMGPEERYRALSAAEKFVRTETTEVDLLSIMRFDGASVDVLEDFTADRNKLLSILETMIVGENQGNDEESPGDASSSDSGAAFGQDDSEFNVFNTDRKLSALQTAATMLGNLNEKKSLIYFAAGMRLNGIDNQAQLHATVDAAIRAGVVLWTVDARGLIATPPLGDATKGSPGGNAMYTGASALAMTTNLQASQDTLYSLATDTGGKAFLDNNDLARGIVQAQQSISDYYIVSYTTTNTTLDGKFRRVKITISKDATAKLEFRQGYYAGKVFAKFDAADKERQLEDALMLEDPVTELTIAMELNYFQLNRAEYYVPIMVKIPGRELALAKKGGAQQTQIDFVGEVKDVYGGSTVTNLRDTRKITISNETAEALSHSPIEYSTGITLLPGKYMIKLLARDNETGRIGTYQTTFVIPNLNKEEKKVPVSSVVLSGQRVELKDALDYSAKSKDQAKQAAADPLVIDGRRIIPSVTRVFNANHELYVYLQGYQQNTTASKPIVGFVTLYHDHNKVLETQPIAINPPVSAKLLPIPMSFNIDLKQLPVGDYDCQVTVIDPTDGKSTFWQAPIKLVR